MKITMADHTPARQQPETLRLRDLAAGLTVNDLSKSMAFYVDALGFTVKERWENEGVLQGVMLHAGRCRLGLSQDDFAKGRDRVKGVGMSFWLTTAQDLESVVARIKGKGITLEQELAEMEWGGRAFTLVDPDGFRLTITNES
jgi:uncharacterized glyoxalase superfamily protein PhnB